MQMRITFPGGSRIGAEFKGFQVVTDQPERNGGENSSPAPFDLFLTSIGTCAGFYVQRFMEQRQLSTEGVSLTLSTTKDHESGMITEIQLALGLPEDFPPRYRQAIVRAIDQCSVKKHIEHPPEFRTEVSIGRERGETAAAQA